MAEKKAKKRKVTIDANRRSPGFKKAAIFSAIGLFLFLLIVVMMLNGMRKREMPHVHLPLVHAPNVPPPIDRKTPAIVHVNIDTSVVTLPINPTHHYRYWTFSDHVPGPFIRARVGDVLSVQLTNRDTTGMPHNIDFHAVTGPGGGAPLLTVNNGQTKTAQFKLLYPGLFIYHCAVAPIPMHVANGMFGLLLVEPEAGLPKVDKEFYVVQSELYTEDPNQIKADTPDKVLNFSYENGLKEHPTFIVFNGQFGSLTGNNALKLKTGERARVYFGNAGPNLISSFHMIGGIFDKVYREGDLISPPARGIQTTLVPASGTAVVEFDALVPGNYTLMDHSIFRIDKGAVGFIEVTGKDRPDIYYSQANPVTCPDCKVHP